MPIRVVVAAVPGMNATSLAVTLQALDTANQLAEHVQKRAAPFRVVVGSADGARIVCGPGAFELHTVRLSRTEGSLVIVPGTGAATEEQIRRLLGETSVKKLCEWLAPRRRNTVAASCSGVFVLAKAGLLDGRAATTSWWLCSLLAAMFPQIRVDRTAMVIEERKRCTAGAALAQLDLMLHLIAREAGPALAALVARYLVVDERPSQARYVIPGFLAQSSVEVTTAERWIRTHLQRPFGILELAQAVGTSPRTLARRFVAATGSGPLAFVQRVRVDAARHLLATTQLSVDAVAARVGYDDPASLRRAFARFGERPSDARRARRNPAGTELREDSIGRP